MKAKLNFKSKRTIIVISIIAVLAIAAGVSAYFFTKGNDTAGATNAGQEEQASNNGVAITENNNGQNGQNNAPESNSNQPNSQDSTPNTNQNDGTQNNDGVNNGTTGETGNNQGVVNANQGTTGTNTGATTQPRRTNNNVNTTTTNIPGTNTDATTTYEQVEENIVVENPWESHMVEWTPENVKTAVVSAKEVTGRDINIEKTAETSTGKTAVSVGDEITYKIKITNNEEKVLNSLYIKDSIPEGTEFVSIDELGIVNEEKTQVSWNLWNLGLKKGESKEVSFKVKVTEKAKEIKTIKNIAYAENTPSDEDKPTKNPVLESSKSHEIVRNNEVIQSKENVPAKVGDKIEYTITVKNLGEIEGTTSIKDSDLAAILENEKATLEGNIILKNGNGNGTKIEKDDLIKGFDINVKANETATVKFSLVVNKVDGKIKNVATIGGSKEDEDIVETIDWAIEKSSKLEEKNGTIGDGKAEKGDIIHYTIKITNKGSKKIEDLVVEDELLGWIGDKAKKVTIEYNGIETIEDSYEVTQADIDAQEPVKNMAVGIYDNEEKTSETENPVVEATQNMSVVKEADKTTVKAGDTVNYTITVTNTGNVTLTKIPVTDVLTTSKGTQNLTLYLDKEYTTPVTEIEKLEVTGEGSTIKLYVKYDVTQADIDAQQTIINVATAKDTDSKEVPVTPENSNPSMSVVKEADKTTVKAGDTVNYTITVTNTGNVTLTKIPVTDVLTTSKGTQNLTLYLDKEYTTPVTEIEKLEVTGEGSTIKLYAKYDVTQADIDAQQTIINVATAKDTDSKEVPVTPEKSNPSIDVQKTIVKVKDTEIPANTEVAIKAQKEDKITYQIVATNNGNTTLSNVKITDDKNVTLESATLPERLADMTITTGNTINANTNLLGRNDITLQPGETITLTVSYTLQKADVLGSKDFVNKATATGKYDKTEPKAENSATIETEFTPEMGDKSVEKVWDDENYASNRPKEITVQLMNGTTKVGDPVQLSETNEWKHTWEKLPLEDKNGKAITYTVKEDKVENYTTTYSKEQNGKFVIKNSYNKPKAGGTITIHSTKSQEVNAPLDVVFILDTSGSMDDNSRATKAVTAINKAIAQVQGYNQYNRVGVVGFSGTYKAYTDGWGYHPGSKDDTDSTELLKLNRYTAKTTSNDVKQYLTINDKKINTNVKELPTQNGRYVDGGTYTQIGIAEAANMLQKADKKVTIDGVEATRTPVIILISDGEPTYYTESYEAVTSQNRGGTGRNTTADHGYYTILSANNYKQQVTTHYGRTAMMYTIGMGIKKQEDDKKDDDLFARTVLNPDTNNKDKCSQKRRDTKEKQLYNRIQNISNYADGAYFGEMKEEQLTKILEQVIQASIPKERTEKITAEQIKNAKVELKDIDTTKEFSLKAGKTTYKTFEEAKAAGVIAGDETNGYYVDLTKVPAGSDLEISYHEK